VKNIRYHGPRALILAGALLLSLASSQKGVGIAPPRFELVLPVAGKTTKVVDVFCQDIPDQQIDVEVVDWWIDPEGTVRELPKGANPYSASNWLSVESNPFNLTSDAAHPVRFSIDLPNDSSLAGSYWTAIAFTTRPRPVKDSRGVFVSLRTRVLAIIYVTIQGTERPAAGLQGISLQLGIDGKKYIVADVVNKGNVYLRLQGEFRLLNAKGEVVGRSSLPQKVLLRDGLVRYRVQIPEGVEDEAIMAAIEVQPQGPAESYGGPPLYGEVGLR